MLREAPLDAGRDNIANEIMHCDDDKAVLLKLGQHYSDTLMCYCKYILWLVVFDIVFLTVLFNNSQAC